jgi:hypothetical protein
VPASALDLGELGHELATVDLVGDGLTLRVKAQPARALAVGRNTIIGNEISHGSASIVAAVPRQLPFVQILNVGLDLYSLTFWVNTYPPEPVGYEPKMTCGSPVDETLRDPGYLIIDRYHDLRLVPTIDVAFSFSIMRGDEQFRRRQRKQDRASGVF